MGAVELYEYFKGRANAYQITDFVKLNHQVRGARWNTADGRWVLEVEDLKTGRILQDQAEVFINAAGFLKLVYVLESMKRQLTSQVRGNGPILMVSTHLKAN